MMPLWPSTDPFDAQAVFVKDGKAWTLQVKTGQHTPEDKGIPVQTMFPGLAFTNLTSVLAWPADNSNFGTLLLYYHNVYSMFSMGTHQVVGAVPSNPIDPGSPLIPGPVYPFGTYWSYISQSFEEKGPDATFALPGRGVIKSLVYLCVDGACDIFDAATHKELDLAGGSYTTLWPGLPFRNNIDAIVPWPNGKLYFFKGDQYAVVDLDTGKVDPGYPRPIN